MKKKVFYTEYAYLIGNAMVALGTALLERADFGMSMIVAPAYLLHLKVSQFLPFFSFGMAEYVVQFLLIAGLSIGLRKFRIHYLFSFVTAILYGIALDGFMLFTEYIPALFPIRILLYILGMIVVTTGVSLMFHTYFAPESYELVVKEISAATGKKIAVIKTVYDLTSLTVGVILSFAFFGLWHFEGIWIGTLICALINGAMIGGATKILEHRFEFQDKFPKIHKLMDK